MLLICQLPLSLNETTPVALGILKALSPIQSVTVDYAVQSLSNQLKQAYRLKLKSVNLRSINLDKIKLSSSKWQPSLWKSIQLESLAFWLTLEYPLSMINREDWNDHADRQYLCAVRNFADNIMTYDPKIVAFTTHSGNFGVTLKVAKYLHEEGIKTIIGGPSVLWCGKKLAQKYRFLDCVVSGEAEPIFKSIVLWLIKGWKVPRYIKAPMVRYLDLSPCPDYSDLNLEAYKTIGIETQRGCPNRCTFCTNRYTPAYAKYREKSLKKIKEEVETLMNYNKPFFLCDNITNSTRKRLLDLCKLFYKLKISWTGEFKADITWQEAYWMAKSGCFRAVLGVESLSNKVLRDMRKPTTVEKIAYTIRNLKKAGINVYCMFMFGFPTERLRDVATTIIRALIYSRWIDGLAFGHFNLNYNSITHLKAEKYGIKILDEEWGLWHWTMPYHQSNFLKTTFRVLLTELAESYFHAIGKHPYWERI